MDNPDEFLTVLDLVPEGCVPLHSFRIVEYMDPDGFLITDYDVSDGVAIPYILGLIELAKHAFINDQSAGEDEEDE